MCVDLDPAVVEPEHTVDVAQGEELTATCNTNSSLQTHTVWLKVKYTHAVQYNYTNSNNILSQKYTIKYINKCNNAQFD